MKNINLKDIESHRMDVSKCKSLNAKHKMLDKFKVMEYISLENKTFYFLSALILLFICASCAHVDKAKGDFCITPAPLIFVSSLLLFMFTLSHWGSSFIFYD